MSGSPDAGGRTTSRWKGIREVAEVGGFVFWVFACLVMSVVFVTGAYAGYEKNRKIAAQMDALEAEIARLRARNDALRREAEALTNDPVHIERLVRRHFKMMRDDEHALEAEE
ncbi:MAG: septum formation initiator family protein [Planctomycetes bacterium]|nr:septum formation initiator family protein [Planctomycetota bacterium]